MEYLRPGYLKFEGLFKKASSFLYPNEDQIDLRSY